MGVLSLCWRGPRRQALRTLRNERDMLRGRTPGPTDRRPLPHQHRQKGEIAETVRSAPGRDPRMARFIRIFSILASETGHCYRPGTGLRLDITGSRSVFRPDFKDLTTFRGIDDGSIH